MMTTIQVMFAGLNPSGHPPLGGTPEIVLFGAIAVLVLCIGIPAIPAFWREFRFYFSRNWDFTQDSGIAIYKQNEYVRLFGFLPLGIIKLLYHFNRFAIASIFLAFPVAALFKQ